MASRRADPDIPTKLSALGKLLETAVRLTSEMDSEPLLSRLTQAFLRMPRADREPIVSAIEREVEHRVVTSKTASMTGYTLVPNPGARLYLRVFRRRPVTLVGRDRDDMMLASLRSLKAMPLVLAPSVHDEWHAAAREACEQLEPEERSAAQRVLVEMLDILTSSCNQPTIRRSAAE